MDAKNKELAALAASVAARCQPCFRNHLTKAHELGIGKEDIEEAINLGKRVGEVGGQRMVDFVESVLQELSH